MSEERTSRLVRLVHESAPLRRKISASLRQAIEQGSLKPGERLVEKDLCRELNVSRTSLREAFRELESEGLLMNQPRGMVVAQVTDHEASNIYKVRAALEALVSEQFAQDADDAARAELVQAVERLEHAYAERQYDLILSAKKEFYETLCRGADNLIVLDMLNRLNSRITQLRSASLSDPVRGTTSMAEIRNLAAALLAGDAMAARAAAVYHVASAASYTANLRRAGASAPAPLSKTSG
jgi:DNA-binding GntR family transcriptional regulator